MENQKSKKLSVRVVVKIGITVNVHPSIVSSQLDRQQHRTQLKNGNKMTPENDAQSAENPDDVHKIAPQSDSVRSRERSVLVVDGKQDGNISKKKLRIDPYLLPDSVSWSSNSPISGSLSPDDNLDSLTSEQRLELQHRRYGRRRQTISPSLKTT